MDEQWREGFARHVGAVLLEQGQIASETPNYYGGCIDYELTSHVRRHPHCTLTFDGTPQIAETVFQEFKDTFYEGDESTLYLDAGTISCSCGKITHATLRMQGSIGEVIRDVFQI